MGCRVGNQRQYAAIHFEIPLDSPFSTAIAGSPDRALTARLMQLTLVRRRNLGRRVIEGTSLYNDSRRPQPSKNAVLRQSNGTNKPKFINGLRTTV